MDRRTRRLFAILLVVVIAATGGAALIFEGFGERDPLPPSGTETAIGVIVAVDSRGLGDVRSFTLRTTGGAELTFDLSRLENGAEFPPGHLLEHQVTAERVRVSYREAGAVLQAIRLQDAGG